MKVKNCKVEAERRRFLYWRQELITREVKKSLNNSLSEDQETEDLNQESKEKSSWIGQESLVLLSYGSLLIIVGNTKKKSQALVTSLLKTR